MDRKQLEQDLIGVFQVWIKTYWDDPNSQKAFWDARDEFFKKYVKDFDKQESATQTIT